ncbi:ribosome small subunit-dependent GTPase A [Gemmobacter fulvus]|uniref:ribosome small subunit-dependent GTPase A n=1 Tax=Gemmobacter fulvus TaxID=2840474 RepID=UPI002796D18B|nr:ribosome small subunit-dependent GTPase A [Gemmobacter fulvus]MDQ1849147.1 ribosome small subunit-dependent GTPase A [Gemmobacter fulvus]
MSSNTVPPAAGDLPAPPATLADLGWRSFFADQLEVAERDTALIGRVNAVHRSRLHVIGVGLDVMIPHYATPDGDATEVATTGDWLLLDPDTQLAQRLLRRASLIKRIAPGHGSKLQLIAANIDTLFIVTSCNQDFNVARLERYLTLAHEAEITPVIVLTKSDLAADRAAFRQGAADLLPGLEVVILDARVPQDVAQLVPWCGRGQTVAFVGSSGVGKSTLINTLTGSDRIATQGLREDDAKGRHTTSVRQLHRLPSGGYLMDTPGMRELQLTEVQQGIEDVFSDISDLSRTCRFHDCQHESEPGCAVRAAIAAGEIDEERFQRWKKLVAEDAANTKSLTDRHIKNRSFGRMVKAPKGGKGPKKDRY